MKAFDYYGINSSDINSVNMIMGSRFGDYLSRVLEDHLHFKKKNYYKSDLRVSRDLQTCHKTILNYRKQASNFKLCEFDTHEDNGQTINKPCVDAILRFIRWAKELWYELTKKLAEKTCAGIRSVIRDFREKLFKLVFGYCETDSQGLGNELPHKKDIHKEDANDVNNIHDPENEKLTNKNETSISQKESLMDQQTTSISKKPDQKPPKIVIKSKYPDEGHDLSAQRSTNNALVTQLRSWRVSPRVIKNMFLFCGEGWLHHHATNLIKRGDVRNPGGFINQMYKNFRKKTEDQKNEELTKTQECPFRVEFEEHDEQSRENHAPYDPRKFQAMREGLDLI